MKLGTDLHKVLLQADTAWSVELRRLYGENAGDIRYTKAGQGEEGSTLRALYDARTAAQNAWHADR